MPCNVVLVIFPPRLQPRVRLFVEIPGHILPLDHVHNLSAHSQSKEHNEVHEQYWPEDRQVKEPRRGAQKRNDDSSGCVEPEGELGQSSDERSELLVVCGWQSWALVSLCSWIELWGQKGKKGV